MVARSEVWERSKCRVGYAGRQGWDGIPRRFQVGFGSTFSFGLGLEFGHEFNNYSECFSLVLGVF